jgi:hypothetical protein
VYTYNVASSILAVNCGVGGSLIEKKTDYTLCRIYERFRTNVLVPTVQS